ncbi:hypothetical protein B0H11DRAFT_2095951 [Mycena galericulata]|nr:hypothetical protein B0H11DRAFT_2095951 [Mycena galericulata]
MRIVSVVHVFCALVLAAAAAPLDGRFPSRIGVRDNNGDGTQDTDIFHPIELRSSAGTAGDSPIVEEVDPQPDYGCVIA